MQEVESILTNTSMHERNETRRRLMGGRLRGPTFRFRGQVMSSNNDLCLHLLYFDYHLLVASIYFDNNDLS